MTKQCKVCKNIKEGNCFSLQHGYLASKCKDCKNKEQSAWRATNTKQTRIWNRAHPESRRANRRRYCAKNYNKVREEYRAWRAANREKALAATRAWAKANRGYVAARNANRRAAKLNAAPIWLSANQLLEIKEIYKKCPVGWHVDHIVPLLGKEVRGLHVSWNLQYLPAVENCRKGNRL